MPPIRTYCFYTLLLLGLFGHFEVRACIIQVSADTTICRGDTVTMTVAGGGPYQWAYLNTPTTPFSTDSVVQLVLFYNTSFLVSSPCGQDTIYVSVRNPPQVTFGGNPFLCPNGSLVLDAQSVGDVYVWNTGDSTQTIIIRNQGWYSVTVTNGCGSDYDSIYIPMMPPPPVVHLPGDTVVCPAEVLQLRVSGIYDTLWWSTGDTLPMINTSDTGTYAVFVANHCGTIGGFFHLGFFEPMVEAGNDTCICTGDVIQLAPGSGFSAFQWSPAGLLDDDRIERPSSQPLMQPVTFTLSAIDSNGCPGTDTVLVCLNPLPVVAAGPDTLIEYGEMVQLWAYGASSYRWQPATLLDDPNVSNPITSPQITTTFQVTGTDSNGCSNTAQVLVEVDIPPQRIWAPTAFTPNGDGRNDLFQVVVDGLFELRDFMVFDRWGQVVFRGSSISDTWDGTFGGTPMPIGSYVVYLRLWDPIHEREVLHSSNLILVR